MKKIPTRNYYKTLANGYKQKYMGMKNGKEVWEYIYRIKAGAKKGEIVHHKDGNKSNNAASNLEVLPSRGAHNTKDPALHRGGRPKGS